MKLSKEKDECLVPKGVGLLALGTIMSYANVLGSNLGCVPYAHGLGCRLLVVSLRL